MLESTNDFFKIYESADHIPPSHWNNVVDKDHIYLSLPYLSALEYSLPETLTPLYVLIYDSSNEPLIAGVFQIATFTYKKVAQRSLFLNLFKECRNDDDSFSIKGLVNGNIFATGAHGYSHKNHISERAAIELLATTMQDIKRMPKFEDAFSVQLFKEFRNVAIGQSAILEGFKYRDFQADVQMVLPIHPGWNSFEAYLQSMKAKYRTKANSAFKKSDSLKIKSLSEAEIKKHESRLMALFERVLDKSDYRYGEQFPKAFSAFKKKLGDGFICKGVFLGKELIAFSTAFINKGCLDANYVGIDYRYNTEFAVYERLLYDFVAEAISLRLQELHLGRTCELIKSAVGAIPVPMTLYAKHTSKLKNTLLKPILEGIEPSPYELRKPFKAVFYKN